MHRVLPTLCTLAFLGCQAGPIDPESEVSHLITQAQYEQALRVAAARVEKRPGDPAAQADHRRATLAFLVARARTASFEGEDEAALALLERAISVDPESETAATWYDKTRTKLGNLWYERARDEHVDERLDAALTAYERSLSYTPENETARAGAARVLVQMNYREGLSDEYYNEGVRALHEYWLQVARSRFQYAFKYRPGDSKPERRTGEVDRLLSQRRTALAAGLEEDGFYAAARNEYHLATLLDAENQTAVDGRERMKIEAEAARLLDAAAMMILRGEWDRARGMLNEGRALTLSLQDEFDDELANIGDAQARHDYEHALDLEHDFRYEEAIEVYAALLDEHGFYDDARSRLGTLTEYVEYANELYTKSARAGTKAERAEFLRQIESFWPEYKDIQAQLERLDAASGD